MQEEFDGERIAGIVDRLLKGESLAQASDIPQEDTESVFEQAMELYSQGRYGDAEKLFRLLCLIVHDDSRFWMGLGACLQGLARYADAVDAYSLAAFVTGMKDPLPLLYGSKCHLLNGDRENAVGGLQTVLLFCDAGSPEDEACAAEARRLLALLGAPEETEDGSDASAAE